MENEENRGLIDKNASGDQFTGLISSILDISHYSLSLSLSLTHSWTLRFFLEHFGIGARKEKKERGGKEQAGKGRIKWVQQASLQVSTCMCIFLTRFGMHGIACVSFLPWHGFF